MANTFISGNYTPKYTTTNPITRFLTSNFQNDIFRLINLARPLNAFSEVLEVGSGDGLFLMSIIQRFDFRRVVASDVSLVEVKKAKLNLKNFNVVVKKEDTEALSFKSGSFDLVIACEVLEHVNNPEKALLELKRVTKKYILVSVPVEPKWRILHFMTGKYIRNFGNTPGHINHWSTNSFQKLLSDAGLTIIRVRYPFPWWQAYLVRK